MHCELRRSRSASRFVSPPVINPFVEMPCPHCSNTHSSSGDLEVHQPALKANKWWERFVLIRSSNKRRELRVVRLYFDEGGIRQAAYSFNASRPLCKRLCPSVSVLLAPFLARHDAARLVEPVAAWSLSHSTKSVRDGGGSQHRDACQCRAHVHQLVAVFVASWNRPRSTRHRCSSSAIGAVVPRCCMNNW